MSTNPFFLKGGRTSPCVSDTAHGNLSFFTGSNISGFPDSSDHGSTSDSETSSPRYLELDIFNHDSSTSESVSPMGSLDDYDCKVSIEDSYSQPSFNKPPALKPSSSLLEMSIASLPCESQLKGALIRIREQMAHCLATLTELEEKAKNVPTLQVRISVLQEEKRQLLKQLHSQSSKKQRSRSLGRDEYSVYSRTWRRSEGRVEDDEYAVMKKRLKAKLNSVAVGDYSVDNGDVFTGEVVNTRARTPDHKRNRTTVKSDYVQTSDVGDAELLLHPESGAGVRSIGVGTMKSFTKDVGTGKGPAKLRFSHKAVQTKTVTRDSSCDPLPLDLRDAVVNAVPHVKSTSTSTVGLVVASSDCGNAGKMVDSSLVSVGIQTTLGNSMVSTGIGVCTVDDELCANCASRETLRAIGQLAKSGVDLRFCNQTQAGNLIAEESQAVSEIAHGTMSSGDATVNVQSSDLAECSSVGTRSEILRSVGVGNCCVTDSFCIRCDCVKTRSVGVGNSGILDLLCDRCATRKTRSFGTSTDHKGVKTVAVGDCCISDNYCDRCMRIGTNTVGVGDCCLTDNFCDLCVNGQTELVKVDDFGVSSDSEHCISPGAESVDEANDSRQRYCDANINVNSDRSINDGCAVNCLSAKQTLHESSVLDGGLSAVMEDIDSDTSNQDDSTSELTDQADVISKEVIEACALLSRRLQKDGEIDEKQMISCVSTVEKNWFSCVSSCSCAPDIVRCFLKMLKDQIPMLLETIVNLSDSNGNNALHYAVSFENWRLVDVLLQTGLVAVDLPNKVGYSSVMLAALTEVRKDADIPFIKRLLEAGNCDKQVEETGQTPLMLAAGRGRLDKVDLLLEAGVEVNAVDDDGSTALMCACEHGYIDIVKRLLAHSDCDSGLEDNEGSTALSIAMDRNHKDIALLIYGHMKLDPAGRPL